MIHTLTTNRLDGNHIPYNMPHKCHAERRLVRNTRMRRIGFAWPKNLEYFFNSINLKRHDRTELHYAGCIGCRGNNNHALQLVLDA